MNKYNVVKREKPLPQRKRHTPDPVTVEARRIAEDNRRYNINRPAHEHRSVNVVKIRKQIRRAA